MNAAALLESPGVFLGTLCCPLKVLSLQSILVVCADVCAAAEMLAQPLPKISAQHLTDHGDGFATSSNPDKAVAWLQAEAFARVREPLARHYRNANTKPDRHATFLRKYVLMDRCFSPEAVLAGVEALTPAEVQGGWPHSNLRGAVSGPPASELATVAVLLLTGVHMAAAAVVVPWLLQQCAGACPPCEPAVGFCAAPCAHAMQGFSLRCLP